MENKKDNSEFFHLVTQRLTGEASSEESARLDELLNINEENRLHYSELVKVWEGTSKVLVITKEDVSDEWEKLHKEIQNKPIRSFSFMKVAASIAILITIGIAFYFTKGNNNEYLLAEEVQTEVLPDGSSVTLNANAALTYLAEFQDQKREVNLKGEAYFDIKKNTEQPFIIHTSSLDVRVLGTSFTVRALENESIVTVVVTSGTVQLFFQRKELILEVGEKGILDKESGQLYKLINDDQNFMSWRTKKFIFNDVLLADVVKVLNNAYQSSLYLKETSLSKCSITVSFEDQSLDSILEILKATLELSIQKTSNGIEISGGGC